jgi:hypothetical protein
MNELLLPSRKDEDQSFWLLRLLEALKGLDPVVRPTVEKIIVAEHELSIDMRRRSHELACRQRWARFVVHTAVGTAIVLFTAIVGVAQAIATLQQHITWK